MRILAENADIVTVNGKLVEIKAYAALNGYTLPQNTKKKLKAKKGRKHKTVKLWKTKQWFKLRKSRPTLLIVDDPT